ncbi:hypothetical protein Tco_0730338 [Tanacetum coccineum]|uniref:Uncharacterized protein n=1 Tax=Tanacetum coccineum TaxID=301880 RepID=A0ABQ4YUB3_9ASTR
MAESSSHNPSSSEITPKEEPVTLDKPESPNPFLPVTQVKFTFEDIAFTTNNEVALLYPSRPNQEYFKDVSDFISKCCLKEAFTRAPTQYKEYLSEFWYTVKTLEDFKVWVSTLTGRVRGEIGYNGEIGAKGTLKKSCLPPRWRLLIGVQVDYAKLIWEDLIHKLNKKIREKIVPYPRFISLLLEHIMHEYDNDELTINLTQVFNIHNRTLNPNQPEEPPFTTHMKAICKLDVPVVSKAPKPSSQIEEVPQGKKPRAKNGLKRKQSLKHTSESQTEASKSKTGQSETETKSSSAKDKSPSHPSPPTPMNMDEGTKNYSFDHIFAGSNPNVLVDKTKSAGDGLKIAHTDSGINEESRADDISKKINLEDLLEFLKDTRSAFFTLDSPQDDPIIITDESEEEDVGKEDTHDTSHDMPEDTSVPPPPSPKSAQIQELMAQVQLLQSQKNELEQQKATAEAKVASLKVRPSYLDVNQLTTLLVTSLKPELSKLLASHNFASYLPTKLKELPSKFTELSREINELKQHVKDMEIKLHGDLKEIPIKLETFTSTISSLTS